MYRSDHLHSSGWQCTRTRGTARIVLLYKSIDIQTEFLRISVSNSKNFLIFKQLVDVPEMEYYASDNQGEICVKGTNVFLGYYKDPERTAETIDENGWHHTGDVGMWLPNGTLKIIDRRKHIFKLSQGEYIVPEKIENIYIRSQYVEQVFVYGESLKV